MSIPYLRNKETGFVMPFTQSLYENIPHMEPYYGPIPAKGRTDQTAATPEEGAKLTAIVETQRAAIAEQQAKQEQARLKAQAKKDLAAKAAAAAEAQLEREALEKATAEAKRELAAETKDGRK